MNTETIIVSVFIGHPEVREGYKNDKKLYRKAIVDCKSNQIFLIINSADNRSTES